MVTITDTSSNGKLLVNEYFVQVVRSNTLVAIFPNTLCE